MARMLIYSDNRATDIILKDLGGPTALHGWLQQNGITGLRVDRTIAQLLSDKRDLWDRRDFEHSDGHGRSLEAALQGRADQAREPQLRASPDGPVPDRQEPDEGASSAAFRLNIRPGR